MMNTTAEIKQDNGHLPAWKTRPLHKIDFNLSPYTVIWEVTQACDLSCVHCRACAQPEPDRNELTTKEGYKLIDQIQSFGSPVFVITGGDPMKRNDLEELIHYAVHHRKLRTALTPSATPLTTMSRLAAIRDAGLSRIAISIDGSDSSIHDAFRGEQGCLKRTLKIIEDIQTLDIPLQINTTVARINVDDLPEIGRLVKRLGAVQWSVFFLVPTGRARWEDMISASKHEAVFKWLYQLSKQVPFDIKATAAQHYRRVAIRSKQMEESSWSREKVPGPGRVAYAGAGYTYSDGIQRPAQGVNDGKGIIFISHTGEVYPSGFLPLSAGNCRKRDIVDIYRNAPLFQDLRNLDKLKGKCGVCEYRDVCGGNRARAWAFTGDYLAEEPACVYVPEKMRKR